jgi:hypothetical protein
LVVAASVVFGAGGLVTAVSSSPAATMMALFVSGGAWVLALSQFNITVQTRTPRWVVGRALAIYQASVFAGLASGAWLWGGVRRSVRLAASVSVRVRPPPRDRAGRVHHPDADLGARKPRAASRGGERRRGRHRSGQRAGGRQRGIRGCAERRPRVSPRRLSPPTHAPPEWRQAVGVAPGCRGAKRLDRALRGADLAGLPALWSSGRPRPMRKSPRGACFSQGPAPAATRFLLAHVPESEGGAGERREGAANRRGTRRCRQTGSGARAGQLVLRAAANEANSFGRRRRPGARSYALHSPAP